MQRELFELIEKVYFHDFGQTPPSYEVEGAASFIDTSEFELKVYDYTIIIEKYLSINFY